MNTWQLFYGMVTELTSEMVRDSCIRFGCDCCHHRREFGRRYDLTIYWHLSIIGIHINAAAMCLFAYTGQVVLIITQMIIIPRHIYILFKYFVLDTF